MSTNYSGSIALSKMVHVRMEVEGQSGKVDGIFIPIEANHLVKGKEGAVYMPLRVITRAEADDYGQHGFISQSVDSKVYKDATDAQKEEFKKLPILGNIKNFSAGGASDNTGSASGKKFTPKDKLPF